MERERERECSVTAYCSVRKERKRAAEDEGSSGGEGTEDSGVVVVVVWCGGETAVRGMCSLNQVSPGAETERNTSLSRQGGC